MVGKLSSESSQIICQKKQKNTQWKKDDKRKSNTRFHIDNTQHSYGLTSKDTFNNCNTHVIFLIASKSYIFSTKTSTENKSVPRNVNRDIQFWKLFLVLSQWVRDTPLGFWITN